MVSWDSSATIVNFSLTFVALNDESLIILRFVHAVNSGAYLNFTLSLCHVESVFSFNFQVGRHLRPVVQFARFIWAVSVVLLVFVA